jgi:TrwC relaxase
MIKATNAASPEYYLTPDCPVEGQELEARWGGKGSKLLGLSGEPFGSLAFLRLAKGLNPETGDKLTARLKADRRDAMEVCVTVPKAVSILIEVMQDDRVKAALWDANAHAMRQWEKGVKVRVRKGGVYKDRATDNVVVASFYHGTTRPIVEKRDPSMASFNSNGVELLLQSANDNQAHPDPQSHIHNYLPNVSFDRAEGIWKAVKRIHFDVPQIEHKFNKRLAKSMKKLGYDVKVETKTLRYSSLDEVPEEYRDRVNKDKAGKCRYVMSTLKVKGVSEEIEGVFSRRQDEVDIAKEARPHLESEGNKTYRKKMEAAKAKLSKVTRAPKSLTAGLTREDVHRFWVSQLTGEQFGELADLKERAEAAERRGRWRSGTRNFLDRVRQADKVREIASRSDGHGWER